MPVNLKKDEMGDVIKDFYKSDAPQFKGKSKEKRREMAIAAKLEAERGPKNEEASMSPQEVALQRKKAMIDKMIATKRMQGLKKKKSEEPAKAVGEATNFSQREKIMKKASALHKHLYKSLHKKDTSDDVNEGIKTDMLRDRKYGKRVSGKESENKDRDARMKHGKRWKEFTSDANKAKSRLRPGEVKRYDKALGKWVSNKD